MNYYSFYKYGIIELIRKFKEVINLKISIIGSGSWGTALGNLLSEKAHEVFVWGRNTSYMNEINEQNENKKYLPGIKLEKNLEFSSDINYVVKGSKVIVFAIASQGIKSVLEKYSDVFDDQIIVNVAKGIDVSSLNTMSQLISKYLPNNVYVALSGPSHAEEVSKKIPTTIVSASRKKEDAEFIQDLFTTETLRVYTNPDVIGVEIGGALKNIIAIGAGISDGLGYGDNAKAALMTRGIREIARLGTELGGREETFKGLTGIGDLIVTCTSMHSRNRRCGILLGEGKSLEEAIDTIGMVVEGATTIKAAYELSKQKDVYMPITKELYRVLYEGKDPLESVSKLMLKRQKHEFEEMVHESDWS
ncbi:MAG TPA: NAD(P)H-dependent glycerol-3-phosphate dehydrogenase [Clostridia bacterium]|nr:NAD(P)H-dependent glycerol-3-phosphate dehydrogenase [Clostridia bacterium]